MTFLNASPIIIIKSYSDPSISLSFEPGDKYNIIAIDDEAVIIEKLKDTNNPYVVSLSVLREISFHFPF